MLRVIWCLLLCLAVAPRPTAAFQGPANPDFEAEPGDSKAVPGWFVPGPCASGGWSASLSGSKPADGNRCAVLARKGDGQAPFGNLMQSFSAEPYRGKRLIISAKARLGDGRGQPASGRIQLWVRVDRANEQMGFFDNCGNRPVTDADWKTVTFKADIDDDAVAINLGMMVLGGDGPASLDSITLEVRDKPAVHHEPPKPLTDRALHNLVAFARAVGYIRHYHPSDEAASLDWDHFTSDAIAPIEAAATADDLAKKLQTVFAPIAPSAEFQSEPFEHALDPKSMLQDSDHPTATIRWKHRGFGPSAKPAGSIYVSERIATSLTATPADLPNIGDCITKEVPIASGESLWMRIPIALYTQNKLTLPRPTISYSPPEDSDLSGDDRSTRLGAAILGWNILQHFFPYFDVIRDDWSAVLPETLSAAATDPDANAFRLTLEKMIAHLHDGHGHVVSRTQPTTYQLPLLLTFIGEAPIVLRPVGQAAQKLVHPGDVIVSIGGEPATTLIAFARAHEPAATEGFFRWRAAMRIAQRPSDDPVNVELRAPDGATRTISLTPIPPHQIPPERGGPIISEPRPGIWYVDLDRATDKDLDAAMPHLAEAKGLVLDMRGYPSHFSMGFLGHFADEPLQCARWEIPLANWPDREHLDFDHARWNLPPLAPPITARTAFITDGRAISAAETFMGIVEAYKLAEIVGEPTAGTNGNVNAVSLPGGYSIMFTGMKVLKHDGSQHHGVGIIPTIPAHRTVEGIAAGKDEMLDAALDAVSK
jgi:hypothetical protein